jgi:hypothetical protein
MNECVFFGQAISFHTSHGTTSLGIQVTTRGQVNPGFGRCNNGLNAMMYLLNRPISASYRRVTTHWSRNE